MPSIGLIGVENSHAEHFIRFLNLENRHPGFRITTLASGPADRAHALAANAGITQIVDDPADLVGRVDAAIVCTRDGAQHRAQAEPLLAAGIPTLVDKPLATTVEDADAILSAARAADVLLYSASALRFSPQVGELTQWVRSSGGLRHLQLTGAGDADGPHSGLFFYGIHHVEAALQVLGDVSVADLRVEALRSQGTTIATMRLSETILTTTFVPPTADGQIPFHAGAVADDGVRQVELKLGRDYNAPVLDRFIDAMRTGRAPVDEATMRAPIVVLDAIRAAL